MQGDQSFLGLVQLSSNVLGRFDRLLGQEFGDLRLLGGVQNGVLVTVKGYQIQESHDSRVDFSLISPASLLQVWRASLVRSEVKI